MEWSVSVVRWTVHRHVVQWYLGPSEFENHLGSPLLFPALSSRDFFYLSPLYYSIEL